MPVLLICTVKTMSTMWSYSVQCVICGKESKQTQITSYSNFKGPDLDFRPPPRYRETMDFWIQECPFCGYINTRLDASADFTEETIKKAHEEIESGFDWDKAYAEQLDELGALFTRSGKDAATVQYLLKEGVDWDRKFAMRFAKFGFMLAKSGNHNEAAKQFLITAWYFDDDKNEPCATYWRKMARKQIELIPPPYDEILKCIYADILRRTGDFPSALGMDENGINDSTHIRMIKYQKELSKQGDRSAHKIIETGDDKYSDPGMCFLF